MNKTFVYGLSVLSILALVATSVFAESTYRVVIAERHYEIPEWKSVADTLAQKHDGEVLKFEQRVDEVLPALQQSHPRYTCFVSPYPQVTREFVAQVHQLTRALDSDPYTDTLWGILTGYDAENALQIAKTSEPLTVKKVGSGTEFAMEMVEEGVWYDELVEGKKVQKQAGGDPKQSIVASDTTRPLVDLLNDYEADLFITSGHATERNWQIGYTYKNGYFISKAGQLIGRDTAKIEHLVASANPKVYLPIGNCLMGNIKGDDSMALAWMNSAGVHQMIGYTVETWFGYGGWGCLDYFVEQPGRYTFAETFFVNHQALLHKLDTNPSRGLQYDRDVVVLYGDPAWECRMKDRPKAWDQSLVETDGVYEFTLTPNRGAKTFEPINSNGAQRGGRPIVQLFPHRLTDVEILQDNGLQPLITDDFLLIPLPKQCEEGKAYQVVFKAKRVE